MLSGSWNWGHVLLEKQVGCSSKRPKNKRIKTNAQHPQEAPAKPRKQRIGRSFTAPAKKMTKLSDGYAPN
jgi:hypothetical protein